MTLFSASRWAPFILVLNDYLPTFYRYFFYFWVTMTVWRKNSFYFQFRIRVPEWRTKSSTIVYIVLCSSGVNLSQISIACCSSVLLGCCRNFITKVHMADNGSC
jgi:hypothetical protein